MNRDELHERIQRATDEFTNQIMSAFGSTLQSIVADLTDGLPQTDGPSADSSVQVTTTTKTYNPNHVAQRKAQATREKPANGGRLPRRSNKELEKAGARVIALLRERGKPMPIEQINAELGTTTKELMRPMKKLLDSGRLQRAGQRRSTVYFIEDTED